MKYFVPVVLILISVSATAQHQHGATTPTKEKPAMMMSGLGSLHHPVSTKVPQAQKFFDQGFTLVYAFNHDEAIRSFKRAAELDPDMTMAYWGIALALGPNINLDVDSEREKQAYEATQKALSIASKAPENERAYVEALAKRYSNDPKADLKALALEYSKAMADLMKHYPDDLDAATLYADSLMNLHPWKLWSHDGKPTEGTEEMIAVLESVLKRDPMHIGANHLYVHAMEASPNPERALPSAERLKTLVPAAGHLVHMPAHIYSRTGYFRQASEQNEAAIRADDLYLKNRPSQGFYALMYYNHNIHFLSYAASMEGRYQVANRAAEKVSTNAAKYVKEMPMVDAFVPTSILVMLHFRKWNDVLKVPEPAEYMPITRTIWHFARAVAYARTGKMDEATKESSAFSKAEKALPADALFGLSPMAEVVKVAEAQRAAEMAFARKEKNAADLFAKAVEAQDALDYDEPPDWYYPIRETLGTVLLQSGKAAEAEKVFREDLQRNPRNGRSLFGLMESLKAQNKMSDAAWVEQQFKSAWKRADTQLRIEDF